MSRLNKFVIIDLETTGHTPKQGDRIIEVGLVVYEDGEVTEQFTTLVNPNIEITHFITHLTGISNDDVRHAPIFEEIADELHAIITDAYFVAHNVPFDLGFINAEFERVGLEPINLSVIDTVELSRIFLPQASSYKLGQLAESLNFVHTSPHRALSDALVTTELLDYLLNKLKSLPYETLRKLMLLEGKLKSDLSAIFDEALNKAIFIADETNQIEEFRGFAFKKQSVTNFPQLTETPSYGELVDHLFYESTGFANYLNDFEARPSQYEMATTIYDTFQSKKHAMIEAATGTGKSLAYLIPAIYQAVTNHERVIVSTHLTQLQRQLMEKEIPLLKRVLPFPFQAVMVKGKQHYLSLARFEQVMQSLEFDNYDITLTKAILLVWLTETWTGDFDELTLPSSGERFVRTISTEAEGGLDPQSPWFQRSFYLKAIKKAQKADVVITNHALLSSSLTNEKQVLPAFKKLIIDEAHHLEETAAKHVGFQLHYVSVHRLLKGIGSTEDGTIHRLAERESVIANVLLDQQWDRRWEDTKAELDQLFRHLFQYVMKKQNQQGAMSDVGRYQYTFSLTDHTDKQWKSILEMVNRLVVLLEDLTEVLSQLSSYFVRAKYPTDIIQEIDYFKEQLDITIERIRIYFLQPTLDTEVKWIEIDKDGAQNSVYLYQEPIDVGEKLQTQLFEKMESIILTSATMTVKQSFAIFKERLGFTNNEIVEKQIDSPFSYSDQVQLLIPNDFPVAKFNQMDDFIYATCEAIVSLAELTKGRMLILFTSYDMLKKTYYLLKEWVEDEYMLIAQGISSGSRSRLKKNFQTFEQAILLGTNSFWEGVDIPGSDLTCVVIVRLPFQPPNHPVYQAKANFYKKQGHNPFMSVALPNAVIRFKQGFGRLIRSSKDRGIVFVCDDRLMTAKYGKYFTDSIPPIDIHYQTTKELLETAENWL